MTLAKTLEGIREASAIMHRATEELRASGIMDRVIKVGDKLPASAEVR
jgi:hypothetical protein